MSKVVKIPLDKLSGDSLGIMAEMLDIIVHRTHIDNPEQNFIHSPGNLHYFGEGHQLKVSKLGDTLYSTMKDLIVYVMEEMAKESEVDYKFQMPKHTSFVGAIIKTVGIDVIANNPTYRDYVHSLAVSQGRYPFDMNSDMFQTIYKDTVLKLEERGFLFANDPELLAIRREINPDYENPSSQSHVKIESQSHPSDTGVSSTPSSEVLPSQPSASLPSLSMNTMEMIPPVNLQNFQDMNEKLDSPLPGDEDVEEYDINKSITRKRVILPYLRRLFETRKAAAVTEKRIALVVGVEKPDEEIQQVFNQKFDEVFHAAQEEMNSSYDVLRGHCLYTTLAYLKEHFSKERVDVMEKFIKSEKAMPSKARKRYVKVPSGKRPHLMEPVPECPNPSFSNVLHSEPMLPLV